MPGILFEKKRIDVEVEGPLVILKLGNVELKLDYEAAIQLSTWLRVGGKQAKRNAGDLSRHWTIVGNLTAVQSGERPW